MTSLRKLLKTFLKVQAANNIPPHVCVCVRVFLPGKVKIHDTNIHVYGTKTCTGKAVEKGNNDTEEFIWVRCKRADTIISIYILLWKEFIFKVCVLIIFYWTTFSWSDKAMCSFQIVSKAVTSESLGYFSMKYIFKLIVFSMNCDRIR